jgi:DNA-binding SARP family transcriptional activator
MIGFYYKRKGLQKLFENVFGKFEIEKEKKECPLLSFRPKAAAALLCVWPARRLGRNSAA